jgi:hypothetical protein
MSGKPRLFLFDAGPIIGLHELGLWESLLDRAEVVVPALIADKETIFWRAEEGVGHPINLRGDEAKGLLEIRSTDAAAVAAVLERFDPVMRERIDPGEAEAITLLDSWEGQSPELCTADGAAARAACVLGFSESIVALEEVLRRVGLARRGLASKYSIRKMRQWLEQGRQMRLRGEGLAR